MKHLAVIVKGGHPFPAGELARVSLEGVGPRGAGTARVALPSAVADASVDPAKSTPGMALEVWDPEALAEEGRFSRGETEGARRRGSDSRESDAADVSFAALFGDFARADPRAVRGVVAVRLDALSNDVRRARRRAAEPQVGARAAVRRVHRRARRRRERARRERLRLERLFDGSP